MIVWSGLGYLVAVITFALLVAAEYVSETITGNPQYYQTHPWVGFTAFLVAAAIIWKLGAILDARQARVYVERDTGREVIIRPDDSLFFIRLQHWTPLLLILGFVFLLR